MTPGPAPATALPPATPTDMRILYVTAGYPPESLGGVELHVAGLARAAATMGDEPCVLARSGRPGLGHLDVLDEEVDGVPVTRLGNTFEDATSFERLYDHDGLADAVAAQVRRLAPDVVHVHHLTCLSVGVVERCRALGVPVVMTLHDFWMGCPRGQRITANRAQIGRGKNIGIGRIVGVGPGRLEPGQIG